MYNTFILNHQREQNMNTTGNRTFIYKKIENNMHKFDFITLSDPEQAKSSSSSLEFSNDDLSVSSGVISQSRNNFLFHSITLRKFNSTILIDKDHELFDHINLIIKDKKLYASETTGKALIAQLIELIKDSFESPLDYVDYLNDIFKAHYERGSRNGKVTLQGELKSLLGVRG